MCVEAGEDTAEAITSISDPTVAKEIATLVVVNVIKETIQTRARKSQVVAVASRLQAQAEIVEGYPKAMYHLCTAEDM